MNKDSRITIGIALLYFISGLSNLLGPNRAFVPFVFVDSFLLALLSLVFVFRPFDDEQEKNDRNGVLDNESNDASPVSVDPFRKQRLIFLLFGLHYSILGCLSTGIIQNNNIDVANQILLLVLCVGLYTYSILKTKVSRWQLWVPGILFVATFAMGYLGIPALVIAGTAVFSALWQVYLLARPDIATKLSPLVRRFYLLIILTVFFDAVFQAFIRLNFS